MKLKTVSMKVKTNVKAGDGTGPVKNCGPTDYSIACPPGPIKVTGVNYHY